MTKIKLCGLSRAEDIEAANRLMPEYIGFVFAPKSRRRVTPDEARAMKELLSPKILAVGVFAGEGPERVADLLEKGIIDMAQLHGGEDEGYIRRLRELTGKPLIRAFRVRSEEDIREAEESTADHVLLDSGSGSGGTFDWALAKKMRRPYFLAGGLSPENIAAAVSLLGPFAVDVSSGIETGGVKDREKMTAFVRAVRTEGTR